MLTHLGCLVIGLLFHLARKKYNPFFSIHKTFLYLFALTGYNQHSEAEQVPVQVPHVNSRSDCDL